jgi:hypothetical protein
MSVRADSTFMSGVFLPLRLFPSSRPPCGMPRPDVTRSRFRRSMRASGQRRKHRTISVLPVLPLFSSA